MIIRTHATLQKARKPNRDEFLPLYLSAQGGEEVAVVGRLNQEDNHLSPSPSSKEERSGERRLFGGFKQGLPSPQPCPARRLTGQGLEIGFQRRIAPGRPWTLVNAKARGFTLIELLLVLVILGVLAAIVVPKFAGRTEQARVTAAHSQIATFGTALDAFEVDNGYYPKGKDGLQDLVRQPANAQNWRGPYMKAVPADPWGHDYSYEYPGKNNLNSYDIMSMGPDGRAGGDDDITNWQTTNNRR